MQKFYVMYGFIELVLLILCPLPDKEQVIMTTIKLWLLSAIS